MSEVPKVADGAILEAVGHYYSEKLGLHGPTPRGVDWNSAESQALRFNRLLQVLEDDGEASLNDYGCGYGALVDYVSERGLRLAYCGFDISEAMIAAARARHNATAWCSFTADAERLRPADYTVASGIFNVKLGHPSDTWHEYVLRTLAALDSLSIRGFAFNVLSAYSDANKRRDDLYYADPLQIFDFCKRRFSPRVLLLHDYPLYEFTMIVRK
jgi:SAM-dependent methyltransferase